MQSVSIGTALCSLYGILGILTFGLSENLFFDIHKSVKSETRTGRRPNRVIESFQKEQTATPEAGLFGEKDRNVMKKLLPSLNDDSLRL